MAEDRENAPSGRLNMQDQKMEDKKNEWTENAGPENVGPFSPLTFDHFPVVYCQRPWFFQPRQTLQKRTTLSSCDFRCCWLCACQWLCKGIAALFNYLQLTTFFWMLVEGLYLHTIIVCAFSASRLRLWYYVVIGWGTYRTVTAGPI